MTTTTTTESWNILGANGQPIFGNTHRPEGDPTGVMLIAHGFKGYKDYGMFPRLAQTLAERGFIAHRFNFSHSGMTNTIETFERPDLFARDTWNKQVTDLREVIRAVANGDIAGKQLPFVLFGHSRGGVSALLTAGRYAGDDELPYPSGIVTAAAPATCNTMSEQQQQQLLDEGSITIESSRTGQELNINAAYLQEQLDDPEAHDVLALVKKITCPLLIVHGDEDPTVPPEHAEMLGKAAGDNAEMMLIGRADHVFNTPNPLPVDQDAPPELQQMMKAVGEFAGRVCSTAHSS